MACSTPLDIFRQRTEYLPDEIYERASYKGIWINLIPRDEYVRGSGLTLSTFTIERSEPTTDEPAFTPIALTSDNTYTGSCGTTYNAIEPGFTERTYSPEGFGWRGPTVCSDDLIYSFNAERFLAGYVPSLTKNTQRTIENRLAAIFTHFVPKGVANDDFHFVAGQTGAAPQHPNLTLDESECEISQDMLDETANILNEEGASDPNTNGWIDLGPDGPLYPLYIGSKASKRLLRADDGIREDYRFAYEGTQEMSPLIKRLGATKVVGSFRHIINLFPPRYTYAGGAYTRVPTWIMPAATKGEGAQINPAWQAAPFEGMYVLSPWVFHSEIVRPVNSAAGLNWTPKNYMGEWNFVVGGVNISGAACLDPLEKLGAHFAEYKHAPRPIFPQYGRLLIQKRCDIGSYACDSCS